MIKFRISYGILLIIMVTAVVYRSIEYSTKEKRFSEFEIIKKVEEQIDEQEKTKGESLLLFSKYLDSIPTFVLELIKMSMETIISLLFLSLFRRTVISQEFLLIHQTKDVLYRGLILYLMGIAVILIFLLSLVGLPAAILILLMGWVFSALGESALSVIMGKWIIRPMDIKKDIYIEFGIGLTILQILKSIPIIGLAGNILIIPTLSLGMFAQLIIARMLNRSPMPINEYHENEINPYHQEKLYEVITHNLKKDGEK